MLCVILTYGYVSAETTDFFIASTVDKKQMIDVDQRDFVRRSTPASVRLTRSGTVTRSPYSFYGVDLEKKSFLTL